MPTYLRADNAVQAEVDDTLVLLAPTTAEFFALNSVGARVWELLADGPLGDDELVRQLLAEYEVEPDQCRTSVTSFLTDAVAAGVIVCQP